MFGAYLPLIRAFRVPFVFCALWVQATLVFAQNGMPGSPNGLPALRQQDRAQRNKQRPRGPHFAPSNTPLVTEVNITGYRAYTSTKIRSYVKTRANRNFDPEQVQSDVRRLMSTGLFHDVRPYIRDVRGGVEVTFEVFERPTIQYVEFVGNKAIKDRTLRRELSLADGESLNLYAIEEARRKIETLYLEKGFPKVSVDLIEGNRPQDRGVVFMINEGQLERILVTSFQGNTIVTDARLKTQIKSKPGILYLFRGQLDRAKLDEDLEKLTAYYRSLGYFGARIGREVVHIGKSGKWVRINFVVDEGPRYIIRNISFAGNEKYSNYALSEQLGLKSGQHFNLKTLNRDLAALRDAYGSEGHIFADIQADPRFLDEPGQLDLVYNIREGEVVRAGDINVSISGEHPHTKTSVARTRVDIQPGDIIDIRKIRASERRLRHSQLFENDPTRGTPPRIVVRPPEGDGRF